MIINHKESWTIPIVNNICIKYAEKIAKASNNLHVDYDTTSITIWCDDTLNIGNDKMLKAMENIINEN
jgi:hypothetical protein